MSSFFSGGNAQANLTSSRWMTSQSISESQSLVTPSLYLSHKISRNLAKLAVDSLYLSRGEVCGVERGAKFNTIPGDIGDDEYSSLCDDKGLVLVRINYCQRALSASAEKLTKKKLSEDSGKSDLSQSEVENIKQMRALINHDYLVLELQRGGASSEKFYILAHKLGKGGKLGKAGIYISAIDKEALEADLHEGVKLCAIDCGNKHIPLKSLVEVLKEADPHYSIRDSNCWDYATKAAKRLAMECAQVAGISAEEKVRLEKESKSLEATLNLQNMHNTATLALNWSASLFSSG